MNAKRKTKRAVKTLALDGELTIGHAVELKTRLENALKDSDQVQIRLKDVTAVDLSCLQLLCAAHRTATATDKELTLEGERPAIFREIMKRAGFTRQKGCALNPSTDCLWCGGDE